MVPGTISDSGTAVGLVAAKVKGTEDAMPGEPVLAAETEPVAADTGVLLEAAALDAAGAELDAGADETDDEAAEAAIGPRTAARMAYARILRK